MPLPNGNKRNKQILSADSGRETLRFPHPSAMRQAPCLPSAHTLSKRVFLHTKSPNFLKKKQTFYSKSQFHGKARVFAPLVFTLRNTNRIIRYYIDLKFSYEEKII